MATMETALGVILTRLGFPNLGIPYWDWTQDQKIPTLFDNLNQKIPSIVDIARGFDQRGGLEEWRVDGIPLQFLTSDDQYYTVVPDGNPRVMLINWTKFLSCNKDPECSITIRSMVIKQQCDGNQRQVSSTFPGFTFGRLPDNFRNSMTYEELVHMAMMAGNLTNFETILFGPHTFVHINLGCLMEHQETATYDPLFLFHHAYVDKVFADWQAAHPHVQPPPGDFMLPFNL